MILSFKKFGKKYERCYSQAQDKWCIEHQDTVSYRTFYADSYGNMSEITLDRLDDFIRDCSKSRTSGSVLSLKLCLQNEARENISQLPELLNHKLQEYRFEHITATEFFQDEQARSSISSSLKPGFK